MIPENIAAAGLMMDTGRSARRGCKKRDRESPGSAKGEQAEKDRRTMGLILFQGPIGRPLLPRRASTAGSCL